MRTRGLAALAVAVPLLALAPGAGAAPGTSPGVQDMRGFWRGFDWADGSATAASADVSSQTDRRFQGTLSVGDDVFQIDGTISASGNANVVARGPSGVDVADLGLQELGEGGAVLDGTLRGADARLVLLRGFAPGGSPAPVVDGMWDGPYQSDADGTGGQMAGDLADEGDGHFSGVLDVSDPREGDAQFDVEGEVSSSGKVKVIGAGPAGLINLEGRHDGPDPGGIAPEAPRILGRYVLDIIEMNFHDEGIFEVIRMNVVEEPEP